MHARNLAALVPFALVALASFDCGGKTDDLLPCPADGTCTGDCRETVTDCMGAHELSCTCDSTGHAACPELGEPDCQMDCNALQQGQTMCSIEGETCVAPMQSACVDAPTLYCTCKSGQFDCPAPPPSCPEPACPSPDQVTPGAPCAGLMVCDTNQTVTDCDGNEVGVVRCQCSGGTFGECTSPPVPVCAMDAGMADASK